jgi:transposase
MMHTMDGKRVTRAEGSRRRHSDEFKQTLVERSLVPGASVAAIAQDAGINANLLFNWRRLHLQSLAPAATDSCTPVLLPVTVVEPPPTTVPPPPPSSARTTLAGTIEIEISGARIRLRGAVDEASLGTVLRALAATA